MKGYEKIDRFIFDMKDELEVSERYIKDAMMCKNYRESQNANTFYDMSAQELHHAELIQTMAVNYFNEWSRAEKMPDYFCKMWEDHCSKFEKKVAELKYMMERFTK